MEEKLFLNNTRILEKEHKELNKVIFIMRVLPLIIIYELMALVFVIYGIISKDYFIVIIFSAIMLLFPFIIVFTSYYRTKKIYQKYQDIYQRSTYTYSFYEEGVKIDLDSCGAHNDGYFKYQDLKIVETKDNIYLFVSASNAYVVSINGFESNFDRLGFRSTVQGKVKKYKFMGKM